MGEDRCWVKDDKWIEFFYVYAPILLILTASITLYAMTANKLYRSHHKDCQRDKNEKCRVPQNIKEYKVRYRYS